MSLFECHDAYIRSRGDHTCHSENRSKQANLIESQMDTGAYVYVLREREFRRLSEPVYKIGRTGDLIERMKAYPNGSAMIMALRVSDAKAAEDAIKAACRAAFRARRFYGVEYFEAPQREFLVVVAAAVVPWTDASDIISVADMETATSEESPYPELLGDPVVRTSEAKMTVDFEFETNRWYQQEKERLMGASLEVGQLYATFDEFVKAAYPAYTGPRMSLKRFLSYVRGPLGARVAPGEGGALVTFPGGSGCDSHATSNSSTYDFIRSLVSGLSVIGEVSLVVGLDELFEKYREWKRASCTSSSDDMNLIKFGMQMTKLVRGSKNPDGFKSVSKKRVTSGIRYMIDIPLAFAEMCERSCL